MRKMKDSGIEWIGDVPAEWRIAYPKQLFHPRKERARHDDVMLTASQHHGMIPQDAFMAKESYTPVAVEKGHDILKHVEPGDFVISMRSFQGGLEYSRIRGKMSSAYLALASHSDEVDNEYYRWLFKSDRYIQALQSTTNLVRDGQALRFANFIQVYLPVPSLVEQGRIASFLTEKCGDIDKAIEAAEASIEEYEAYKRSKIFLTVTRGINSEAPLKDSQVEWVGMMPDSWELRQLGKVTDQTKCPNTGMIETNLLSLSYGKVKQRDINATEGLLPESFEGYNIIEGNDIVLRFTDLQNDQKSLRVGRANERGIITSAYVTIRPFESTDSRYIYYALHSYDLRKGFYGMGAGVRQGLKWQEAKYILLPWPSELERNAICDYLDRMTSTVDASIAEKKSIIEELKAYKRSLICEVVTGKREI